jgi:hypothetical protein
LCLAENERENRDIQVNGRDAQQAPGFYRKEAVHSLKDLRGVILPAFPVQCELRIKPDRKDLARDSKRFFDDRLQIAQQSLIRIANRQQLKLLHGHLSAIPAKSESNRIFSACDEA